jgi:DNA ligase (NAD+)
LDNSYSKEDLIDWEKRVKSMGEVPLEYTCGLKYDGDINGITYEERKLTRAVTRGDGLGMMLLNNIKTISFTTAKGDFPDKFDVRRLYCLLPDSKKMNQDLIEMGETYNREYCLWKFKATRQCRSCQKTIRLPFVFLVK